MASILDKENKKIADKVEEAASLLAAACDRGQVQGATLHVRSGTNHFKRAFGTVPSPDAAFLLGSISKPIVVAALMTLHDQGHFSLDAPVRAYLPEFTGGARDQVTVQHLLTHVSGLPDQLPNNAQLRQSHAPLSQFVEATFQVPLHFEPGTCYEYSSMGILLASEIAQRLTGMEIRQFVHQTVLQPLGMHHSALGMGSLAPSQTMLCQVEHAAPEAGGGVPGSEDWGWNSPSWRALGSPWGGVQASAADVCRFLDAFLHPTDTPFSPETARLMIRNHNPEGITPRGLGFDVSPTGIFGHTGSTGTIAWADPARDLSCVVLTTLPAGANSATHPRQLASNLIAVL